MTLPILAFIKQDGCPACADALPHWKRVQKRGEGKLRFVTVNISKDTINFPVEYTPTLRLVLPGAVYQTDPHKLKDAATEASITRWVNESYRHYQKNPPKKLGGLRTW